MQNTTLCYIEHGGKYLLLHRIKKVHDVNQGKYVGIGGHMEEGESPHECAIREVKEETGLDITTAAMRYCGIVTFVCDECEGEYMHLFHIVLPEDEVVPPLPPCDEGELEWAAMDEVSGLPQWEGDKIFLRMMQEMRPFFSLKLVYKDGHLTQAVALTEASSSCR